MRFWAAHDLRQVRRPREQYRRAAQLERAACGRKSTGFPSASISASHAKSSTQPATDIFMPEAPRSRTASFKLPLRNPLVRPHQRPCDAGPLRETAHITSLCDLPPNFRRFFVDFRPAIGTSGSRSPKLRCEPFPFMGIENYASSYRRESVHPTHTTTILLPSPI